MFRGIWLVFFVVFSGVAVASAQEAVAPVAGEAAGPGAMQLDMTESGLVSLDFREADIKNVLKVLAYKSGVNIITGPEVVGQVTIQLKEVPWQKALDVILSTYGYSYEQKGSIIMVTTVENLKKRREDARVLSEQEPVSTETFILNFAKAEDVAKAIEKMKSAKGSVNHDKRTNVVIVTDILSNLQVVREVVASLDAVTPQVLIEAKIIETALQNDENFGVKWPTSITGTATFPGRSHTFPWKQGFTNDYIPTTSRASGNTLTYGTLSLDQVQLMLEFLDKRQNTKSVSNPSIVTLDNQPARIQVGTQYPVPDYTYNEEQAKMQVSGWNYIDTGVIFNVTPHINNASMITLDIEPRVTDIGKSVTVQETDMPQLNSQIVKTTVMIKDGETLVIAGLIKDSKESTKYFVPVLGHLPLLGRLFQHREETDLKTELMIFLTPRIVTPELTPLTKK
ncbi:MAG: hypothetical protein GX606_05460 [Elusimicrobia bacterium]|nr:hypothetical protein [Elusimicrobiota bacterium]